MQTLNEYLNEHRFHDYVFMYGRKVYQKLTNKLGNLIVDRVERDNYGMRYVIYLRDACYNHTVWPTKIKFNYSKNIKSARSGALVALKQLTGITIDDDEIVHVNTKNHEYCYKLHCHKRILGQNGELLSINAPLFNSITVYEPYLKRV